MKKILTLLVVVFFSLNQLLAQESVFNKGDKALNLGIGFGSGYYAGWYTSRTPAISASYEVGVVDNVIEKGVIGVGGYAGYSSAKYSNYWKTSNFLIGARGLFHYPLVDKLDTYAGLLLGYNIVSTKDLDNVYGGSFSASSSGISTAGFVGGRYFFKDTFAVMGELGWGISYLTLGITLKM
jgi:hypothetical protein